MKHLTAEQTAGRAASLAPVLTGWRRELHRHPELSFREYRTAAFIAETLERIEGMQVERGIGTETSVIGTLTSGEGPVIALRADIDALPITEENDSDYRSEHSGIMHACGHDAHTAILLGTAVLLGEQFRQNRLKGTVRFVFQPAEEWTDEHGMSGSPYLMKAGVYNGADAAVALHMCPWLPVGEAQVHDGASMANVDVFEAKIFGTGGHGAYPELGTDPVWMLGPVMQALHGVVARRVAALDPAVISIGQVHAGTASNIIPTEVKIEGTLRSYSADVRDLLAKELEKAFSVAETLGGSFSLRVTQGEPALINDARVNRQIREAMQALYPAMKVTDKAFGMGGEDFGYVTQAVPGAMFFLGCASDRGSQRDLHTPVFDIDERCLPIGAAILTETAKRLLTEGPVLRADQQTEVQVHGT